MAEEMKVLYVQPGKYPEVRTISNDLKTLQGMVGDTIQTVYPWADQACIVCNDEGKLLGLPLNRLLEDYDVLAGDFLVCGLTQSDFCSLTDAQLQHYEAIYHSPVYFMRSPLGLLPIDCTPEQYASMVKREKRHNHSHEER